MPGGGVFTARGGGEVFAAVVVEYFAGWVVCEGTGEKKKQ